MSGSDSAGWWGASSWGAPVGAVASVTVRLRPWPFSGLWLMLALWLGGESVPSSLDGSPSCSRCFSQYSSSRSVFSISRICCLKESAIVYCATGLDIESGAVAIARTGPPFPISSHASSHTIPSKVLQTLSMKPTLPHPPIFKGYENANGEH